MRNILDRACGASLHLLTRVEVERRIKARQLVDEIVADYRRDPTQYPYGGLGVAGDIVAALDEDPCLTARELIENVMLVHPDECIWDDNAPVKMEQLFGNDRYFVELNGPDGIEGFKRNVTIIGMRERYCPHENRNTLFGIGGQKFKLNACVPW